MTETDQARAAGYNFVPANSINQAHLSAFAAAVWPDRPADQLVSRWWRRAEPSCATAAVHEATGAMAGFCSARPSDWVINGQTVSTLAICDWYVDPAHAGKGLGKCLLRRFETVDKFVFAFSVSDAAVANFKKLGWAGPHRACLMLLPLPAITKFRAAIFAGRTAVELENWVIESAQRSAVPAKRKLVQHQAPVSLDDSAQCPLPLAPAHALAALGPQLDCIEGHRLSDGTAHMRRGEAEWRWRLSVCGARSYHLCVARRAGEPVGYVALRRLMPGSSRQLGHIPGAIITDLVAVDDEPAVLQALATRAATLASELGALVVLAVTSRPRQREALVGVGFLSPDVPLLGRALTRRSPQYMWKPKGPGTHLSASAIALNFADSDVDLLL
jgi:ribosomal protein S18 acetylase RimI-like enzyme